MSILSASSMTCRAANPVVADTRTREPLSNVSVFAGGGRFIGTTNKYGRLPYISTYDFPITVRCLGYKESILDAVRGDTLLLEENAVELPEVLIESKQKKMLHILAYVREYSTLSSYTDTITMFREKMVDFMLSPDKENRKPTWRYPRVLKSRSYYRFTDADGLDSVSNLCNQHFTWSDWVSLPPIVDYPEELCGTDNARDTIRGHYGVSELWTRNGDKVTVDVDVLTDESGRRWVRGLSAFFRDETLDFEQFRLRFSYDNVTTEAVGPTDLTGYSLSIESRGRGHSMFQFNRYDQPFFVTTYTEVYILDKEYITAKEAKKWDKCQIDASQIEIFEPLEAPELDQSTLALIERVNNIDANRVRLGLKPDHRLAGRHVNKRNFQLGHRALSLLKQLTGITLIRSHRNFNKNWRDFQHDRSKDR